MIPGGRVIGYDEWYHNACLGMDEGDEVDEFNCDKFDFFTLFCNSSFTKNPTTLLSDIGVRFVALYARQNCMQNV